MSRQEKYFHPVKDLLSSELKDKLVKSFFEYKNNLSEYNDENMLYDPKIIKKYWEKLGFERQGITYTEFENEWKNSDEVRSRLDIGDNFSRFYNPNENYSWLDEETYQNLKEICEYYGANNIVFLYTKGLGVTLKKHTDPNGKSKITFPLYPDYDKYRSCNFYDSMDQKEPTYVCEYSKIKSAVILNVDKIHALENCETDESLCIQFTYDVTYNSVLKSLSRKRLLTTTI
jgi:hypothetical protein